MKNNLLTELKNYHYTAPHGEDKHDDAADAMRYAFLNPMESRGTNSKAWLIAAVLGVLGAVAILIAFLILR